MQIIQHAILCLLVVACAAVTVRTAAVGLAVRRHRLLHDNAACCESLGFVGISAVCVGAGNAEHIESLLGVEYDRYELIVVLDSQLSPDLFRSITARYGMIRVNCSESGELPAARVRALYRSRRRCYRRLILVDRSRTSHYEDLDAGAAVASYDYILPVGPTTYLMPDAVETAAIAISDRSGRVAALRSDAGRECTIFHRDTVIDSGGFSARMLRRIPRRSVLRLRVPLAYGICDMRRSRIAAWSTIFALLVPLITIEAVLLGIGTAAATVSAAALSLAAICYTAAVTSPHPCSVRAILCYISRMRRLFSPRRFTVS